LLKLGPAIAFLGATPIAALAPIITVWRFLALSA
jgi:hypothetical protein